jgi:hypothetical protein
MAFLPAESLPDTITRGFLERELWSWLRNSFKLDIALKKEKKESCLSM